MSADAFLPCAFGIPPVPVLSPRRWREQGETSTWGSGALGQSPRGELAAG